MTVTDRAERDRKAFEGRLKTVAAAGLKDARRYAQDWWERMHSERLTAENIRMDGFFEHITHYQILIDLWTEMIEALSKGGDAVATWHGQIAKAEQAGAVTGGTMGNPVADARQHLWRDANEKFALYAADSFRRVS
ncbi:hypothetical protein AB0F20_10305 [Streptomyces goshikiensis]|uniref:hypothetical protein n=1 Tax=Streptomyces goshikiensis TaxID=1942 RepID=UPI003405D570